MIINHCNIYIINSVTTTTTVGGVGNLLIDVKAHHCQNVGYEQKNKNRCNRWEEQIRTDRSGGDEHDRMTSFPAGVGPGSSLRDAANWLLSRFGLSVETRRQYMVG